jgi:transcriptional regulator of arginine metabolism
MKKSIRQSRIIELIHKQDIETQEELAAILNSNGCNVTQSTVSRDIRELNLTKVSAGNGRQKYVMAAKDDTVLNEKYTRVMRDAFLSVDIAQNLLVVKTVSGMAMAVAAAIDALEIPEVLGCIAGDDTIFCAIKTSEDAYEVMKKLSRIARH